MAEAACDPVVALLLERGNALRQVTVQRNKSQAAKKRADETYEASMQEYLSTADLTRTAVLAAAAKGFTTPTIAEILGINEAWVTRIRTAKGHKYSRIPSSGPKLLRAPAKAVPTLPASPTKRSYDETKSPTKPKRKGS